MMLSKSTIRRVLGPHRRVVYNVFHVMRLVPRRLTARWRREPDYIIIGAQKCGTASLFAYLAQHPQVGRSLKKEVSYFNVHFENGYEWYRAFFPLDRKQRPASSRRFVTGEATPDYVFDPRVPVRVAAYRPAVKLILLLRDPVHRAFSHYHHNVRKGNERRSFEDALRHETDILERRLGEAGSEEERTRVLVQERRWFYLARGRYHEQLRHWLHCFPQKQMLVLQSEELFRDPALTFARVLAFLGLDQNRTVRFDIHNLGTRESEMEPDTEAWLREYYRPHNQALAELLGWTVPWHGETRRNSIACRKEIANY